MARIRSIHPDACKSEKLHRASAEAERCYWRLLPHCDDEGRAEDDPRLFRAAMFPLDEDLKSATVDAWLRELETLGLIVRYEAGGVRYLAVVRWEQYQKPQRKVESKLPTPPEPSAPPPRVVREAESTSTGDVFPVVVVGEGDVEGDGEGVVAPTAGARQRDELWETMLHVCGITGAIPDSARGAYNKARQNLVNVGATPQSVQQRALVYRARWPDVSLTPTALARRWAECEPNPAHLPAPRVTTTDAALAKVRAER